MLYLYYSLHPQVKWKHSLHLKKEISVKNDFASLRVLLKTGLNIYVYKSKHT